MGIGNASASAGGGGAIARAGNAIAQAGGLLDSDLGFGNIGCGSSLIR